MSSWKISEDLSFHHRFTFINSRHKRYILSVSNCRFGQYWEVLISNQTDVTINMRSMGGSYPSYNPYIINVVINTDPIFHRYQKWIKNSKEVLNEIFISDLYNIMMKYIIN